MTVNIGAAGLDRAELLLRWLAERDDDVILLTETSAGPGTAYLLEQFRRAGYITVNTPDDGDRGAALVSRVSLTAHEPDAFEQVSIPARVAAAALDTSPRTWWVSVYVPSRDRSADKTARKEEFITSLLKTIEQFQPEERDRMVIGGDYNVITSDHRPLHPGFLPFEFALLDTLSAEGFIDAHARCAPGSQPYSWIGRTGDGYRYDYFHVGPELGERLRDCAYLHETREQRLTDHAAVELYLNVEAERLECSGPAGPEALGLF
ncbi:endonuclease/exonuclease/phosphatase [Nonomuraea longispora]|uniref:Endonuclease/exonuclease/phosphatase n=1 Tax=Nonomuraea longispora TaxID=1848320 RepID=A0A4R4N2N1_9ACTN|nr:endonuclease/exonuclease/phosphatase family protein [Nonomuraea longispora]TDC02981.1 endonuclease/exonuclease/phosphatase [Nonomuraea longispora]